MDSGEFAIRRSLIILAMGLFLASAGSAIAVQEQGEDQIVRTAPIWGYKIVAEYPHDPEAFTQGLVYLDGEFYEGTGLNGRSALRRVEIETGDVRQMVALHDVYFGEGIAIIDDQIYQLTWRNEIGFRYDLLTFEKTSNFFYNGEGWGLTYDGTHLVMSDGSNWLTFRDPETFRIVRQVAVVDGAEPVVYLNELEWVDGEIWANVYQTDWIVRIDPQTGGVTGWIDMAGLLPDDVSEEDVGPLNGIAWDPETGRIFVTGKLWPLLFEIELVEPE
jgi:glutamine cyclotransferase